MKVYDIVDTDKFTKSILDLLQEALHKISLHEYSNALVDLNNAEKILEYGANCGKMIDRRLIITILHNQAYCYQRIGDKLKSSKYVEAINYNLRAHLKSIESTPVQTSLFDPVLINTLRLMSSPQILYIRKLQLSKYELQLCSLISQIGQRRQALNSAKVALKLMQQFFCHILMKNQQSLQKQSAQKTDQQIAYQSLAKCKTVKCQPEIQKLQEYIMIAKYAVSQWISNSDKNQASEYTNIFTKYSIGRLVDLTPLGYEKNPIDQPFALSTSELLEHICHFSMGFFQIGTEYRLICEEQLKVSSFPKQSSEEYNLGFIFHLLSVIIIGFNFPYQLLFMRQVLSSLQYHYQLKFKQQKLQHKQKQINFGLIYHIEDKRLPNKSLIKNQNKCQSKISQKQEKHETKIKNKQKRTARNSSQNSSLKHKKDKKAIKKRVNNEYGTDKVLSPIRKNRNYSIQSSQAEKLTKKKQQNYYFKVQPDKSNKAPKRELKSKKKQQHNFCKTSSLQKSNSDYYGPKFDGRIRQKNQKKSRKSRQKSLNNQLKSMTISHKESINKKQKQKKRINSQSALGCKQKHRRSDPRIRTIINLQQSNADTNTKQSLDKKAKYIAINNYYI